MSKKSPSILFLYPRPVRQTLQEVAEGRTPSERMYGSIELEQRGWNVHYSDARFTGEFAGLIGRLEKYGLRMINFSTVRAIWSADVIVVKDAFSTLTTLVSRALGKKIIYLDAMFAVPKRGWRRLLTAVNLRLAALTLCYSQAQRQEWLRAFKLSPSRLQVVPYTVDTHFYKARPRTAPQRPYVLSVGRDVGRDFPTLLNAMEGCGIHLKLVTLPYLLPAKAREMSWIEVFEYISYEELFDLYAGACAVVVPLKGGTTYLSGIRAALESIVLGAPTIITRTEALDEYIESDENTTLVNAGDVEQLRRAVLDAHARAQNPSAHAGANLERLKQRYGMSAFVDILEGILRSVTGETDASKSAVGSRSS